MALSISIWHSYTKESTKLVRKSEATVEANHVLKLQIEVDLRMVIATVQASMRDQSYKVLVQYDDEGVIDSSCECSYGNYKCHHVAAALLYANKNTSKTDIRQSWLKNPKSAPPKKTTTMGEAYPFPKHDYKSLRKPIDESDRQFMFEEFGKLGRFTSVHWVLSKEPEDTSPTPVPLVEDLLLGRAYMEATNPTLWLRQTLVVNPDLTMKVVSLTCGQRLNSHWAAIRKLRFTASNFGKLLVATRTGNICNTLKQRLLSAYNLETVPSIQWGILHEDVAIKEYCKYGAVVEPTGLWLHESGVLAVSPDGIVKMPPKALPKGKLHKSSIMAPQIIEVKCPAAIKDTTVIEGVLTKKDFYLGWDNGLYLKKNHDYWHQIQGQLHITGFSCCDLIIWTTIDMQVIRIVKDPDWIPNINKLIELYFDKFLPSIV